MARQATGQVVARGSKTGTTYALRFGAYGNRHFVTLGTSGEGWTRQRAERELANVLADVRRGIWQPPDQEHAVDPGQLDPTFHEFASAWLAGVGPSISEKTKIDYRWRLSNHLLPFFAEHRLSAITVEQVDRYRHHKERERDALARARVENERRPPEQREKLARPLSNGSINKTIRLLAVVLEQAVEYGHIDRNPAKGKRRLLRESRPSRSYLQAAQAAVLLEAARRCDDDASERDTGRRRPLLAVLILAGLRISEALDLRWRDVRLTDRKIFVRAAKTEAGVRVVDISPALGQILADYRNRAGSPIGQVRVFPTATGRPDNPSNVRTRVLAKAVEVANEGMDVGAEPIGHVTPHSLRRTFISLLLATGAPVPYVMAQAGHTDPKMTLGIYAQVIADQTDHGGALDELVGASQWLRSDGGAERQGR